MIDELQPVCCGCGGEAQIAKKLLMGNLPDVYIFCRNCSIRTREYYTEAEAITAWNKAMENRMELQTVKERTAKVMNIHDEYDVEAIRYFKVGLCGNCEAWLEQGDIYCSECGARLEWNE